MDLATGTAVGEFVSQYDPVHLLCIGDDYKRFDVRCILNWYECLLCDWKNKITSKSNPNMWIEIFSLDPDNACHDAHKFSVKPIIKYLTINLRATMIFEFEENDFVVGGSGIIDMPYKTQSIPHDELLKLFPDIYMYWDRMEALKWPLKPWVTQYGVPHVDHGVSKPNYIEGGFEICGECECNIFDCTC